MIGLTSFESGGCMLIGYMRVSTADQNLDLQRDALSSAGCEKIFEDVGSGALDSRKGLAECIEYARSGDTLVVWKLDRLGRSLKHLVEVVGSLEKRKVGFKSLSESIDTTSDAGKLVFHIFASLAEFERGLIRERTNAGLKAARARGRKGGRPKTMDEKKRAMAKTLMADTSNSIDEICKNLKVSRSTLYRNWR
jgi:DNA invertase Pin-like site-specific DNA recombinase